jgi:ankyrin repeat protein
MLQVPFSGDRAVTGEEGMEPIFRAVRRGDVEEVARLLDADPHPMEAGDHDDDPSPLILAAERGHVGVVRLLLARGADVNATDSFGDTALHEAVCEGHEEVVSILLSCGADPSRKDAILGTNALGFACCFGYLGVVRQLLQVPECGLDDRSNDGCTALWGACRGGRVEVARTLLLAGADHTIASYDGQTPRQAAEQYGHPECKALLEVSRCIMLLSSGIASHTSPLFSWQWWEGELERGYVVHRARYLAEQHSLLQPAVDAAAAFLASVSIPVLLSPRIRVVSVPRVEVVRLSEDEETGAPSSLGKGEVEKEGGSMQGPSEAERDATVKYVMRDLHPELYIELMAGFHPLRASVQQADDGDDW